MKTKLCYTASCGTSVDNGEQLIFIEMKNLFSKFKEEWTAYVESVTKIADIHAAGTRDKITDYYSFSNYMPSTATSVEAFMESVDTDIRAIDAIQSQVYAYSEFIKSKKTIIESRLAEVQKFIKENPIG